MLFIHGELSKMNTRIIGWSVGSIITLGVLAFSFQSAAHSYKIGDISIGHPNATATPTGAANGAVYLASVKNNSKQADALLSASSPVAKSVELHTMSMDGEVMRMREVKEIEITAGSEVKMERGKGYHIMLIGLKAPLKDGEKIPLKLKFKIAGEIDIVANVEKATAGAHDHHKH
jgi:periplasmic copper chaperone A